MSVFRQLKYSELKGLPGSLQPMIHTAFPSRPVVFATSTSSGYIFIYGYMDIFTICMTHGKKIILFEKNNNLNEVNTIQYIYSALFPTA